MQTEGIELDAGHGSRVTIISGSEHPETRRAAPTIEEIRRRLRIGQSGAARSNDWPDRHGHHRNPARLLASGMDAFFDGIAHEDAAPDEYGGTG